MKRKLDFVTNSSSTSFCAWGVEIDLVPKQLFEKIYEYYLKRKEKYKKNNFYESYEKDNVSFDEFRDLINDFDYDYTHYVSLYFRTLDLDCVFNRGCGTFLIGRNPFDMKEDQTLKEFKDGIISEFVKIGLGDRLDGISEEVET